MAGFLLRRNPNYDIRIFTRRRWYAILTTIFAVEKGLTLFNTVFLTTKIKLSALVTWWWDYADFIQVWPDGLRSRNGCFPPSPDSPQKYRHCSFIETKV
jgi:hypothetical protein